MIRWSYLIPRLVLLTICVLVVWRWLDPLLQWTLVRLGERIAGAKFEVGEVVTRLPAAELTLRDVQVANARNPARNLFEADEIAVGVNVNALLKRKLVIREGRITGLRIGTARATSGVREPRKRLLDWLPDELAIRLDPAPLVDFGKTWLDRFAILLKQRIEEEVEQLESVQLARELTKRWPAEVNRMESRIETLKARADRLQDLVKNASANPLENLGRAQQIIAEVDALHREIKELREEIERLREQAFRDRDAILTAQQNDLRRIREQLRLDDLESGGLSEYLLGRDLHRRLQLVAQWMRWLREYWPADATDMFPTPSPTRARGVDVMFAGLTPEPNLLIRSLRIDGEGQARGERFEFLGTVQGLTSQPRLYGQPTALHVEVRGAVSLQIDAVLDRTQTIARDHLTVECPGLPQPERFFGKPEQIALVVSPGDLRFSLRLELEGDRLSGRMFVHQEGVELKPTLAPAYGGQALADRLREALQSVRTLEATAQLSGTLQKPEFQVQSTLGPQLAQALQNLFFRELESRREEFTRLVQAKVREEMDRFEQLFVAKQQRLLARLQKSGVDVTQLREIASRQVPPLDRLIEKNLPKELERKLPAELRLRF